MDDLWFGKCIGEGKVSQVSGSEFVLFELPEIKFEGNEELIAPYI